MREVNETSEWITEQLHAASAEDYGKDFEHLEVCVKNLLELVVKGRALHHSNFNIALLLLVASREVRR